MNILVENCTIVPMTGVEERHFIGSLGICGDKIAMISRSDEGEEHKTRTERFIGRCGKSLRRIDGRGMAAMPGLVNIHNHASMSLMRGYADDIPLMRWLKEYIWPFEADLTPEAIVTGAELAIAEMLEGGTTTFVDMYWMENSVAGAVDRTGIRAVLSPTFTDSNFGAFETDLDRLLHNWAGHERITANIAPHAPYSCSEENIRRAVELAERHDLRVFTHVSETMDEVREMRQRYGKTSAEYLRDAGFFTRPAMAVHCVHVTEGDMEIFARNGVSVAHNPQSNMKLASGTAPVQKMLETGITVGLGTDGPCSNNDLDMWEEMRSAGFLQKLSTGDPTVLPAYDMLRMATCEGAKAIGMDDAIGSLEEGMLADVILIDTLKPHMQPCHDIIANLAYCAKSPDVAMTIVGGEIVMEQGRCLKIDTRAVIKDAEEYVSKR